MTAYQFHGSVIHSSESHFTSFNSSHSSQSQCRLLQFKSFRSSLLSEIYQISMLQSKHCIKSKVMEIFKWNFKIQTPENVQQEFWVILHFHHQQPAISPAKSAKSLKSQDLFAMSQSSCTSSSIYAISVLSAANSVDDISLFMRVDPSGN